MFDRELLYKIEAASKTKKDRKLIGGWLYFMNNEGLKALNFSDMGSADYLELNTIVQKHRTH